MKTFTNHKMRGIAIFTGAVLAASALFHPAPAQAAQKQDKLYKGGAAALGVLGAYFILKGKTVPGAIAGAGAYYAYKKGKEAKNDDRYSDNYYNNGNTKNGNNNSGNDTYPDGSWSTPTSTSSGNNGNTYPDYTAIAPAGSNGGSTVVLK